MRGSAGSITSRTPLETEYLLLASATDLVALVQKIANGHDLALVVAEGVVEGLLVIDDEADLVGAPLNLRLVHVVNLLEAIRRQSDDDH